MIRSAAIPGFQHQKDNKSGEKSPHARHGGGRDVKIGRDLGLERFQAQPKWEIPGERICVTVGHKDKNTTPREVMPSTGGPCG